MSPDLLLPPQYAVWNLGRSVQGRALDALAISPATARATVPDAPCADAGGLPWVLFLGAVHGEEVEGVWLLEAMRSHWCAHYMFRNVGAVLWAQVNPDGVAAGSRWNARNIDLNRNLPTKDWSPELKNPRYPPGPAPASEPENKVLIGLIEACRPVAILSVHSFVHYQINVNGPAAEWAARLAAVCGYPVTDDIGYPTPGSLGTYAGKERGIPTITLEIERGLTRERVLELHMPTMEAALKHWDEKGGSG